MKNKRREVTGADPFTRLRRNGTNCAPLQTPKNEFLESPKL